MLVVVVGADELACAAVAIVPNEFVVTEMIDDVYSLYPEFVRNIRGLMQNKIMMMDFGFSLERDRIQSACRARSK